jgi:streptomycin 3"-adenylyltransferase
VGVPLPAREEIDHASARPQGWAGADEDLREWVLAIVDRLGQIAASAVLLHGSLAMGSFFRPKSDVDLVAVAEHPLTEATQRHLAVGLVELFDRRPIIGGVELSVVRRDSLEAFSHPMPYEFHFSEKWVEAMRRGGSGPRGTDRDLAAHCTMARLRGLTLLGPRPASVVGEIPRDAYLDAVMDDARWIVDGGILESPFYGVLNLCRCLQLVANEPELPPSKDEGGSWALSNLPSEHRPIVGAALECYRSQAEVPADLRSLHGHRWAEEPLRAIAAHARQVLRHHL